MDLKYVAGDLILLGKTGAFDVIAHGCNCFNNHNRGIARHFNEQFGTGSSVHYRLEADILGGDINKLGQVDSRRFIYDMEPITKKGRALWVCNLYTQFRFGSGQVHVDYDAIRLCFRKMNYIFKGKHIGLPKIGCGLAGGDWMIVERIIKQEFKDCQVTVVNFEGLSDKTYEEKDKSESTSD